MRHKFDLPKGALESKEIRLLNRLYERGALDRREFLSGLMALGFGAAAAGAVVTGALPVKAAEPKKGGKVRFAWDQHGPADTLDPILFTSSIDYARGRLIYNNLTRLQEDLTAKPELAESFEANDDVTEWTFKLRKGIEWHDGSPFTADDVVYSMMRHIGEESTSKAKVLVGDIKEWVKDDDHTVRAIMQAPNAEIPGRPRHLPLQDRQERHDRLPKPGRHRPLSARRVQRPGCGPFIRETRTIGTTKPAPTSTSSSASPSPTTWPGSMP